MTTSILAKKSLLIVFTYAPAGLGHLRVTDALYHGLPTGVTPVLLGAQDTSVGVIHRIMSIHPILRRIMEWAQRGTPENVFTYFYRRQLRANTKLLYQQMVTILSQRLEVPTTVLIIATHFGLAHQLAAIKERLSKTLKITMILVVQVTDDSPQRMWYVDGADVIFVPSELTKQELSRYATQAGLPPVTFAVAPYPVSPLLSKPLTESERAYRLRQSDGKSQSAIHVTVPISGAAVGTDFMRDLMDELFARSHRFIFHVICKSAPFTEIFVKEMSERPYVKLLVSTHGREVVSQHELLYRRVCIGFEITKPSEQAFKALLPTSSVGGSILLFSQPVGRQEYDNLAFLTRHKLIPNAREQQKLFQRINEESSKPVTFKDETKKWRGLLLPNDPKDAAHFFIRCLTKGVFTSMLTHNEWNKQTIDNDEVRSDGVHIFWKKVEEIVASDKSG